MSITHSAKVGTPEEQGRYYETLVEASPTAIVACDPPFIVTSWNPAAERSFGHSRSEAAALNDRVLEAWKIVGLADG